MSNWTIWAKTPAEWDIALQKFPSHNLYQSAKWGEFKETSGWAIMRMVCTHAGEIQTMAQALVKQAPLSSMIVWIPGGPIGDIANCDTRFQKTITSETKAKFSYFRIGLMNRRDQATSDLLISQGWNSCSRNLGASETVKLDFSQDEHDVFSQSSSNWSRNLKRSDRLTNSPYVWPNPDSQVIYDALNLMTEYKQVANQISTFDSDSMNKLFSIFSSETVVVRVDDESGQLLSLRAGLLIGGKGWDIIAVTTPAGRKNYSSYAVFQKLTSELILSGCKEYDLSGIDAVNNPGVYNFKKGTGGTSFPYQGEWEISSPAFLRSLFSKAISTFG